MNKVFYPFDLLLPKKEYDFSKWAVIACDQYTSEPSYWNSVSESVGFEPSTLNMIVPEAFLHEPNVDERIVKVNDAMKKYIDEEVFEEYKSVMVYVEREQSNGQLRKGIIGTIDLKEYDYNNGVECLVRPTEDVVISRIPPRLKVREHAKLETTHVLLLIADKDDSVIGALQKEDMKEIYDFKLYPHGKGIKGFLIEDTDSIQNKLKKLVRDNIMLWVGDGNHSLATAKEYYEKHKDNELARYAMVEVINLYDESLIFEPIHRVVYNVNAQNILDALLNYYPGAVNGLAEGHNIEFCCSEGTFTITIPYEYNSLAVGALQQFLDQYDEGEIDYVHHETAIREWSKEPGTVGFILPKIDIDGLFRYVKEKGRLPRKTFSIGNQEDKRYYLECRRIAE